VNDAFYEGLATWSQVVASIAFLIVLIYLWRRFLTPAVVASQHRKNAELLDTERRRDEAKAGIGAARAEAADADADARAITERGQSEADATRERMLHEGRAESDRLLRNAEGELERGRSAARERLRDDLLQKAVAIARRAALDVDDATNRRLVSEAVDTVDPEGRA
jgi:F0F1-type ATP synthase membrane subunit b/b'